MKIKCWNVFFSHLRQMHFPHSFLDLFHYSNYLKCSQVLNLFVCVCTVWSCHVICGSHKWDNSFWARKNDDNKQNANDARLNCQKVMEKNERTNEWIHTVHIVVNMSFQLQFVHRSSTLLSCSLYSSSSSLSFWLNGFYIKFNIFFFNRVTRSI